MPYGLHKNRTTLRKVRSRPILSSAAGSAGHHDPVCTVIHKAAVTSDSWSISHSHLDPHRSFPTCHLKRELDKCVAVSPCLKDLPECFSLTPVWTTWWVTAHWKEMIPNCQVKLAVKTKNKQCVSSACPHRLIISITQEFGNTLFLSQAAQNEERKKKPPTKNNATFSASSVLALWEVNSVQFIHIKDPHTTTAATAYREHWEAANPLTQLSELHTPQWSDPHKPVTTAQIILKSQTTAEDQKHAGSKLPLTRTQSKTFLYTKRPPISLALDMKTSQAKMCVVALSQQLTGIRKSPNSTENSPCWLSSTLSHGRGKQLG